MRVNPSKNVYVLVKPKQNHFPEAAGIQILTDQIGSRCPHGLERAGKQALWTSAEESKHFKN